MSDKDITITPIRDAAKKPVGWEMTYDNKKGNSPATYPVMVLDKDSGSHQIHISILDSAGIAFTPGTTDPKDGDNAFWVHEGTTSPPSKSTHSQIKDVKLHNGTKLTFKDINNGKEVVLAYQLNFTGAPPLDPIIQNGGGTGPGAPMQEYAYYAAGALLLFAIVAFFVRRGRRSTGVGPGSH